MFYLVIPLNSEGSTMEYLTVFLKAIGMFILGLFSFRIMGSQAVGRLTGFDLVVVIAIGALLGAPLVDQTLNPLISATAIIALVFTQVMTSWLTTKSIFFERLISGKPIKIIESGMIQMKGLRKARISKNDLMQELRIKGITSPREVQFSYLEPSGKLSVIKREKTGEKD